jgi:hypothetical protein
MLLAGIQTRTIGSGRTRIHHEEHEGHEEKEQDRNRRHGRIR